MKMNAITVGVRAASTAIWLALATIPANAANYELAAGFDPVSNPGAVWSCGWMTNIDGMFQTLTYAKSTLSDNGLTLHAWQYSDSEQPAVNWNSTTNIAIYGGLSSLDGGETVFYPGPDGTPRNFGVIRFTVPPGQGGNYRLESVVAAVYTNGPAGDTDYHIAVNGVEIFGRFLAAGQGTGFTNQLALSDGDTVDFLVGRGADGQYYGGALKIRSQFVAVNGGNDTPPVILAQPENQTVLAGRTANFAVTVGGTTPFGYQWYSGGEIVADATNSSLTLSDVQPAQAGDYFVVVTNIVGSVTSQVATLTVAPPSNPSFDITAFSATTNPGPVWSYGWFSQVGGEFHLLTFAKRVASDNGIPIDSWQYSSADQPVVHWNGTTNTAILFGGQAICGPGAAWFHPGPEGTVRNFAAVRFTAPSGVSGLYWLESAFPPFLVGASAGDTDIHVVKNATEMFSQFLAAAEGTTFTNTLNLAEGDTIDFLIGRGRDGRYYGDGLQIQVRFTPVAVVSNLPPVVLVQPENQTVLAGRTATFAVTVEGTPPFGYQWYSGGAIVVDATNSSLTLSDVQPAQAGDYFVVVTNIIGSATSQVATLTVVTDPSLLVLPPMFATTEANGGSSVLRHAIRLQEIYASSQFPAHPITIRELRYRPSALFGEAFTATISNLQLNLSTTPVAVGNLGNIFANNAGTNDTIVFSGALAISSQFAGPSSGPKEFDIVIPFTAPFRYDPSKGNLLVDFRNFSGSTATYVDGGPGHGLANRASALGAESTSASSVDGGVEIVQIVYTVDESIPPFLLTQPESQTVEVGGNASFMVTAGGLPPFSYQWFTTADAIVDATNSLLSLTNVQPQHAGDYFVVVSNTDGSVTSLVATLTVVTNPPVILSQPANQTVLVGGAANFAVTVGGTPPFGFQWYSGSELMAGATSGLLALTNVQSAQAGGYYVVVANPASSVTSRLATLTVETNSLLVVPSGFANREAGGGSSVLRYGIRLQEVYKASQFPGTPVFIQELRMRPSAIYGQAFTNNLTTDLQVRLSTTAKQPGQLSTVFSNNFGADETVVFAGAANFSSKFTGPGGGPKDFDIIIPLATPFRYDPAAGNLLMEFRNFSPTEVTYVDGGMASGLASRVFALGANSATATSGDNGADVIQIVYAGDQPVAPRIVLQPQDQTTTNGGTVTLLVGATGTAPLNYQWIFNDSPVVDGTNNALHLDNVQSPQAGNYFVVVANSLGAVTSRVAVVSVAPTRLLALGEAEPLQEGSPISLPLNLVSEGDVGGMTFMIRYDTQHLRDADFVWSGTLANSFSIINKAVPGEIRVTFARSEAIPAGTQQVATVSFLLRSVPADLGTPVTLQMLDVSSPSGDSITAGNFTRGTTLQITKRLFVGDNNANQRLDVGDATVILELLALIEPVRSWDVTGNDLNQNANLDSGDAIKVLRAATGIDPQPGGGGAGLSPASLAVSAAAAALPIGSETMFLSPLRLRATNGPTVTLQVNLAGVRTALSGVSFTLDYPSAALRLLNAQACQAGSMVPGDTLTVWNVSPANNYAAQDGHVSFAVSGATPWPVSNGVLASLTFTVQAAATNQFAWPLVLRRCEVTTDGFRNRFLMPSGARFNGRDPLPPRLASWQRTGDGTFRMTVNGDPSAMFTIQASTNLIDWIGVANLLNENGSVLFADPDSTNHPVRFYRALPTDE